MAAKLGRPGSSTACKQAFTTEQAETTPHGRGPDGHGLPWRSSAGAFAPVWRCGVGLGPPRTGAWASASAVRCAARRKTACTGAWASACAGRCTAWSKAALTSAWASVCMERCGVRPRAPLTARGFLPARSTATPGHASVEQVHGLFPIAVRTDCLLSPGFNRRARSLRVQPVGRLRCAALSRAGSCRAQGWVIRRMLPRLMSVSC